MAAKLARIEKTRSWIESGVQNPECQNRKIKIGGGELEGGWLQSCFERSVSTNKKHHDSDLQELDRSSTRDNREEKKNTEHRK